VRKCLPVYVTRSRRCRMGWEPAGWPLARLALLPSHQVARRAGGCDAEPYDVGQFSRESGRPAGVVAVRPQSPARDEPGSNRSCSARQVTAAPPSRRSGAGCASGWSGGCGAPTGPSRHGVRRWSRPSPCGRMAGRIAACRPVGRWGFSRGARVGLAATGLVSRAAPSAGARVSGQACGHQRAAPRGQTRVILHRGRLGAFLIPAQRRSSATCSTSSRFELVQRPDCFSSTCSPTRRSRSRDCLEGAGCSPGETPAVLRAGCGVNVATSVSSRYDDVRSRGSLRP